MASLSVRDIDPIDYEILCQVARSNNRSTAAQVRAMIADLGKRRISAERAVADLVEFRKRHAITPRLGEDAVSMIRAIRDE
jgi:hypothetical protein